MSGSDAVAAARHGRCCRLGSHHAQQACTITGLILFAAALAMQKAAGVMEQANFDKMLDLLTRDPAIFKSHDRNANGAGDHSHSNTDGD
jgi:hypothetical protein